MTSRLLVIGYLWESSLPSRLLQRVQSFFISSLSRQLQMHISVTVWLRADADQLFLVAIIARPNSTR